jgi:predicted GIY-YIG superfamily endonuclease
MIDLYVILCNTPHHFYLGTTEKGYEHRMMVHREDHGGGSFIKTHGIRQSKLIGSYDTLEDAQRQRNKLAEDLIKDNPQVVIDCGDYLYRDGGWVRKSHAKGAYPSFYYVYGCKCKSQEHYYISITTDIEKMKDRIGNKKGALFITKHGVDELMEISRHSSRGQAMHQVKEVVERLRRAHPYGVIEHIPFSYP